MASRVREIKREIYKLEQSLNKTRNEMEKAVIGDKILKLKAELRNMKSNEVEEPEVKPLIDAPSVADKEGKRGQVIGNTFGMIL